VTETPGRSMMGGQKRCKSKVEVTWVKTSPLFPRTTSTKPPTFAQLSQALQHTLHFHSQ